MSICMWVLLSCSRKAKERALRQASGWDQAPANYYPDDDEILRIFSGILPKAMCKQWLQGVLLTSHWVYSSSWWTSLLTRCHAKAVTPTCRQDAHRQLFHQWKFMHLAHYFPLAQRSLSVQRSFKVWRQSSASRLPLVRVTRALHSGVSYTWESCSLLVNLVSLWLNIGSACNVITLYHSL